MLVDPLVALAPLQAPLAVQLVAFVELQVRVDEPPLATVVGEALRLAVGGVMIPTLTVRVRLPPMPEQVSV